MRRSRFRDRKTVPLFSRSSNLSSHSLGPSGRGAQLGDGKGHARPPGGLPCAERARGPCLRGAPVLFTILSQLQRAARIVPCSFTRKLELDGCGTNDPLPAIGISPNTAHNSLLVQDQSAVHSHGASAEPRFRCPREHVRMNSKPPPPRSTHVPGPTPM